MADVQGMAYDLESSSKTQPPEQQPQGSVGAQAAAAKKRKRRKKKKQNASVTEQPAKIDSSVSTTSEGEDQLVARDSQHGGAGESNLWNLTEKEERARIREFWLGLADQERRSLVQLEKEAVLKKIKEQQKHMCTCSVCGKRRTVIEEELEMLYNAYYEELEQYEISNQQKQKQLENGEAIEAQKPAGEALVEGTDQKPGEEDAAEEESQFSFARSLTVKGGILTVADDLLKNEGKKFLDMMEKLSERKGRKEPTFGLRGDPIMPLSDFGTAARLGLGRTDAVTPPRTSYPGSHGHSHHTHGHHHRGDDVDPALSKYGAHGAHYLSELAVERRRDVHDHSIGGHRLSGDQTARFSETLGDCDPQCGPQCGVPDLFHDRKRHHLLGRRQRGAAHLAGHVPLEHEGRFPDAIEDGRVVALEDDGDEPPLLHTLRDPNNTEALQAELQEQLRRHQLVSKQQQLESQQQQLRSEQQRLEYQQLQLETQQEQLESQQQRLETQQLQLQQQRLQQQALLHLHKQELLQQQQQELLQQQQQLGKGTWSEEDDEGLQVAQAVLEARRLAHGHLIEDEEDAEYEVYGDYTEEDEYLSEEYDYVMPADGDDINSDEFDDLDDEDEDDLELTEEQRLEEGRRMFQIFAAKMFEQRVLQAYRERVALERQERLIKEEEEEERREQERREQLKKKNRVKREKRKQKQLEKDKARAEEEEKARKHREEEEKRRKAEAAKAEEEARKEAERQRALQQQQIAAQKGKSKKKKKRAKKKRAANKAATPQDGANTTDEPVIGETFVFETPAAVKQKQKPKKKQGHKASSEVSPRDEASASPALSAGTDPSVDVTPEPEVSTVDMPAHVLEARRQLEQLERHQQDQMEHIKQQHQLLLQQHQLHVQQQQQQQHEAQLLQRQQREQELLRQQQQQQQQQQRQLQQGPTSLVHRQRPMQADPLYSEYVQSMAQLQEAASYGVYGTPSEPSPGFSFDDSVNSAYGLGVYADANGQYSSAAERQQMGQYGSTYGDYGLTAGGLPPAAYQQALLQQQQQSLLLQQQFLRQQQHQQQRSQAVFNNQALPRADDDPEMSSFLGSLLVDPSADPLGHEPRHLSDRPHQPQPEQFDGSAFTQQLPQPYGDYEATTSWGAPAATFGGLSGEGRKSPAQVWDSFSPQPQDAESWGAYGQPGAPAANFSSSFLAGDADTKRNASYSAWQASSTR